MKNVYRQTREYQQGYWDAIHGRPTPWAMIGDNAYEAGRRAGNPFKPKKSIWDTFA